jgi:hypothetical protein
LAISAAARRGAILHGHIHWRYHVCVPETSLGLFCAGSTTHAGREGLWMYELGEGCATATPGTWDQTRYVLEHDQRIDLDP